MKRARSNQERASQMNVPDAVRRRSQTIRERMEREPEFKAMYRSFADKAREASRSPEALAKRSESARKAWTPEMREQARQRQREYQERVRLALGALGDVKLSTS